MRHRRCAPLAVLAVALFASPAAAAHHPQASSGGVVVPAGGRVMSQWYKTFFEMPGAVNPLWGNGDPCIRFGHRGKLLSAIAFSGPVTCTAELGTVLTTGTDHYCSSFDPDPEFYAVSERAQRKCALAASRSEKAVRVIVDDHAVNILNRRFAAFSPQTTVHLPVGNIAEVEPQTGTLTAYGWNANVLNLRVGRHLITTEIDVHGETHSFDHIINIVPGRDLE